jgi:hypothetical protein
VFFFFNMENSTKRVRYDDARTLLRRCFRNQLCSQIPFDIWKNILITTTEDSTRVLGVIAQTCSAFRDLLSFLQQNNLPLAKAYRRDGQINQAKMCLENCFRHDNLEATYHMAYAYYYGGWGVERDTKKAHEWFLELEKTGLYIYPSFMDKYSVPIYNEKNPPTNTRDAFLNAEFYATNYGWGEGELTVSYYIIAANQGNEFAQFRLGLFYLTQGKRSLAIHWFFKSANQGYATAQFELARIYSESFKYPSDYSYLVNAARAQNNFMALATRLW